MPALVGSRRAVLVGRPGGFSLAAFMAGQEDGFWYDFGQTDRLFQENVGPSASNDPNEVIGLALDQRTWGGKTLAQVVADAPELVVNGDFTTNLAGWLTDNGGWTWDAGKALLTGNGSPQTLRRPDVFTIGRVYLVEFDVAANGPIGLEDHNGSIVATLSSGRYRVLWTATRTDLSIKRAAGTVTGTVDNVTAKDITGKAAGAETTFGPNLIANGDFASGASWTPGANWTISGGLASKTTGATNDLVQAGLTSVIGKVYRVEYTISGYGGSGAATAQMGANGTARSANGTFVEFIYATSAAQFKIIGGTSFSGAVDNVSVREVVAQNATQTTASFKPKFQTTGAAFDGTDDNLLTGYMAGAGANFIVAKVVVPASIPASQIVAGARAAGLDTRAYLAFDANGKFSAGIGSQPNSTIVGATDRRGQSLTVGLTYDGTTVRLFEVDQMTYSAAQAGLPTTTTPLRIGCWNADGGAGAFFGGSIKSIVAGRQFLDLATFKKIAAAL